MATTRIKLQRLREGDDQPFARKVCDVTVDLPVPAAQMQRYCDRYDGGPETSTAIRQALELAVLRELEGFDVRWQLRSEHVVLYGVAEVQPNGEDACRVRYELSTWN